MSVDERNKPLLQRIYDLKAEHPFWGYRRIWAYLKYRAKACRSTRSASTAS